MEERVPVFTQHTQFFHKLKIRECKLFSVTQVQQFVEERSNSRRCAAKQSRREQKRNAKNILWKSGTA